MRALIIEDNPLVAISIADGLKDLGYNDVVCAASTKEAIGFSQ